MALIAHTPVVGIDRTGPRFAVRTARGHIAAATVVLATNAYTDAAFSWFRKRVIPVGSHMMSTQPLEASVLDALLPTESLVNDTRSLAYAIRKSPDGRRLLVGGRALSRNSFDARHVAMRLMAILREVLPDLPPLQASHAWEGNVAFTMDRVPHIGVHDGVHYVTGCNGSGVVMASYLGARIAKLASGDDTPSAFNGNAFKAPPFYRGNAWFMPVIATAMGVDDRLRALLNR